MHATSPPPPLNPFRDPVLRAYLDDVLEWHGYVRALGLPTMKDNPSVPISQLYVAPALSTTQISPDSKELPEGEHVLQTLDAHRHLVVLGDPGSGKSTLVNWLTWRLAAGLSAPLPDFLQDAIPIPLILRELSPDSMESFDKLLASFLKRPVAQALNNDAAPLLKALKSGKALVLVDGLDELPEHLRQQLITSLRKAFVIYKKAIWLITSRIVGFDENTLHLEHSDDLSPEDAIKRRFLAEGVPAALLSMLQGKKFGDIVTAAIKPAAVEFGNQILNELSHSSKSPSTEEHLARTLLAHSINGALPENEKRPWRKLHRVYVMPFDDKRIENFSRAWYQVRGSAVQESANCDNFLRSVKTNHATHTLARNPQILTLMALVFRTRLDLPQGRALLYEYITQAYLESIDQAYGILDARFTWQEKKRLLGKVGFEMQHRRFFDKTIKKDESKSDSEEIEADPSQGMLFSEQEVKDWILSALCESRTDADEKLASEFLDHISRRSGLLLPRGEGIYAFVHLTFQEYFAALYLKDEICSPEFIESNAAVDDRISTESLYTWSGENIWHETLLFLHELVGNTPRWAKRLPLWVFGPYRTLTDDSPENDWNRLALRTQIADDIHAGWDAETCTSVFEQASGSLNKIDGIDLITSNSLARLFNTLCKSPKGSDFVIRRLEAAPSRFLPLSDCRNTIEKILASEKIAQSIEVLLLKNNEIETLNILTKKIKNLIHLWVIEPQLSNIDALANIHTLESIIIGAPQLETLSPLAQCPALKSIHIIKSKINDLSPFLNHPEITISGNLSLLPEKQADAFKKREEDFKKKQKQTLRKQQARANTAKEKALRQGKK